jgi:hypothetical protein
MRDTKTLNLFEPPPGSVTLGSKPLAKLLQASTVEIQLTEAEYQEAMACAAKRLARAAEFHRVGKNKQPLRQQVMHGQIGCLGERTYCKWRDFPLSALDFYPDDLRKASGGIKPADFGLVDVKAKQKHGRFLPILEHDPRHYMYVLASANVGDRFVTLCGWTHGVVAMRSEFWGDPFGTDRTCYWFPQEKLLPMWSLPQ